MSDSLPGWRLSELLRVAAEERLAIDTTVVIGLLRQLLPAVALFARNNRESAIGNLAPERLLVTPQARLVITEHAFGPAIEKLNAGARSAVARLPGGDCAGGRSPANRCARRRACLGRHRACR